MVFEGVEINTLYANGIVFDTIIKEETHRYIINEYDTLTIIDIRFNDSLRYLMEFQPPNTLIKYNCPFEYRCIANTPYQYKITRLNNDEMIWKFEHKGPDEKTIEIYKFKK